MKTWQKVLLVVAVVALIGVTVLTWGSIGSGVSVYCLITMGAALLVQRFMTNRDSDYFDMEQ